MYSDYNLKLGDLLRRGVERFVYRYDFGDDWEHHIVVERDFEPDAAVEYPILVAGERQAPPDDCGGPPGFEEFLAAARDKTDPEHERSLDWLGEPFDPHDLQLVVVEAMLNRLRGKLRQGTPESKRRPSNTT